MTLIISNSLLQSIIEHAKDSYGEECCGLIVGYENIATKVIPVKNKDDNRTHRYKIDPGEHLKAGLHGQVIGIYHSHPDSPAEPSDCDGFYAWPGYAYLIVSIVQKTVDHIRAWRMNEDRTQFDEMRIFHA